MSQQPDPTPKSPNPPGPETDERDTDDGEDEPDLDGDESFPASDPPAHWMGEDKDA